MADQTALAPVTPTAIDPYAPANLAEAMRAADAIAKAGIFPKHLCSQGAAFIVMETAARMNMPILMIAQNLYIVHGMPAWKGSFCRALIQRSGKYSQLKYEWQRDAAKRPVACRLVAMERGQLVEGSWITMDMVVQEGWDKNPKWKSLREQMFMYRAASFFQRAHCPEAGLGFMIVDEVEDVTGQLIDATEVPASAAPSEPEPEARQHGVQGAKEAIRARRQSRKAQADSDPLTAPQDDVSPPDDGELFAGRYDGE